MIILLSLLLMHSWSFGGTYPTATVTGKVISFDQKKVILLIDQHKYSVPRDSILHESNLQTGKIVQAKIKSPTVK